MSIFKKILISLVSVFSFSVFAQNLSGAGATFPYPLLAKYFAEYSKTTDIKVNYQAIGSGGGQRQFIEQTVHFGVSDNPFTDAQMKDIKNNTKSDVLNIPFCIGAVVPIYNLPGFSNINFSGEVLAEIFLGNIKSWNDPKIKELNPKLDLPPFPITIVHRSDGSGTTFVFTDYLSRVSETWLQRVGKGTNVSWIASNKIGAQGNAGVAGAVKSVPGAIGYTEVVYAAQNNISFGSVRNKSGRFVRADLASIKAAAEVPLPGDARISLVNTSSIDGYPIASYSYLLVYQNLSANKAFKSDLERQAFKKLLTWIVTTAQTYNDDLGYGALPESAKARALALINKVQ